MKRPLEGCRVLDMGIITAGAATAALLADLGAEVIKVESPRYRDPFREWEPPLGSAPALAPFFRCTNRNKRGISLDLKQEAARSIFLRMVARSDVIVENFRRGVLERLGVGMPALKAANEGIILASISSQGESGPTAQYVSFGSTLEAVGGLAAISGRADGAPVISGKDVNLPDQLIAIFAAAMIATAWLARRNGGEAIHLDLSQRELTTFMLGEHFAMDSTGRRGNAEPPYLLQECLRARDGWLAVSVMDGQQEQLRQVTGAATLSDWTAHQHVQAAAESLAAIGIAAAPSVDGNGLLESRHRLWRDAIAEHPQFGLLKGMPFCLSGVPLEIRRDAPEVGADTREVLAQVAGCTAIEIDNLLASGAAEAAAS
jgi:crotonobetainyl-CoA:carnitine CoA-transferase CaiB-like acyl-CoA transferase